MTELSVVVPVYGCRGCLRDLHERLVASVSLVTPSFELIFVDDRSPDGAWETLVELARQDPVVKAIELSRNFGQHAAITAGLAHSEGRWTVVMDCDLEEPPEEIPRLYEKAQEGYDMVLTSRMKRQHSLFRRLAGRGYFWLRNRMLQTSTGHDDGTLSILSRKVVDAFLSLRDNDREYTIALRWLGFRSATIPFQHSERPDGQSSYTLSTLIRVAVDGLFFQTAVLLRWIVFLGFLVALAGFGLAGFYVLQYLFSTPPSGFTSLSVLILVLSGFIITSLGVVGLYVGRVFEQVKGRPLFVVDRQTGVPEGTRRAGAEEPVVIAVEAPDPATSGPTRRARSVP